MQRKTLLSLLSTALLAAMVLAPAIEAQQDGQRRGDGEQPGRRGGGQFGGGRGGRDFGGPGFGGGGGGGMGVGGQSMLGLLRVDAVRQEVKLTEDQQELVEILNDELREGRPQPPENYRELSEEEQTAFRTKMEEFGKQQSAEATATLKTILEESQYQRLQEINIQVAGVSALLSDEVVAALKITDEQKAKIEATQAAQREEMGTAMREIFQGGAGGFDRDAMREKMEALRKTSEEKLMAELTAEQKAEFEAMKGAPFSMPEGAFGRGGRGGGRPGDGGGGRPGGDRPRRPE